ncbi:hypothetical protein ABW19_dt0203790 [Dactylella cylindrospora]|nr:hypothetical protein ABW19_dt0203790 [Dactylella cylindrospora]
MATVQAQPLQGFAYPYPRPRSRMPTKYEKGKWIPRVPKVERRPAVEQWVYQTPVEAENVEDPPENLDLRDDFAPEEEKDKCTGTDEESSGKDSTCTSRRSSKTTVLQKHPPTTSSGPCFFLRLFFCCISTRPRYTRIQHLVIPTSQVCVDKKALRFLQSLSREDFRRLQYIVQEVFTDEGVKVLGRIPDHDKLIEAALKGQIWTKSRPWSPQTRESYVEHVAGLYARLLRKLGTYDKAPSCEGMYRKKLKKAKKL